MAMPEAAAPAITEHPLIRGLVALGLEPEDFVIFGSAPLYVHGYRSALRDLDIVARGEAWERARETGSPTVGTITGAEAAQFWGEKITVYRDWISPLWDVHDLIRRADVISGLRFAPLADVLAYKLMLRRPKDITDIQRFAQRNLRAQAALPGSEPGAEPGLTVGDRRHVHVLTGGVRDLGDARAIVDRRYAQLGEPGHVRPAELGPGRAAHRGHEGGRHRKGQPRAGTGRHVEHRHLPR